MWPSDDGSISFEHLSGGTNASELAGELAGELEGGPDTSPFTGAFSFAESLAPAGGFDAEAAPYEIVLGGIAEAFDANADVDIF